MEVSSASGILYKLICSPTEAEIRNDRQLIRIAELFGKVTFLKKKIILQEFSLIWQPAGH